jgi:excisionase family DNA binding protein
VDDPPGLPQLYRDDQVAEALQIDVTDVHELARTGRLRGAKVGRRWRLTTGDVELYLETCRPVRPRSRPPGPGCPPVDSEAPARARRYPIG